MTFEKFDNKLRDIAPIFALYSLYLLIGIVLINSKNLFAITAGILFLMTGALIGILMIRHHKNKYHDK